MKVFVVSEYIKCEGGDVEAIFTDKDTAIDFVYSQLQGTIKMREYDPDGMIDRYTIYFEEHPERTTNWKIEEWEVRGMP
jgi:hypothetical protein